jgi:nucleotide-binding universal stress UspA family protein
MLPKKILCCTDFSENSKPALQLAKGYAKDCGAELLIVHVLDSKRFPVYADWVAEEHRAGWMDEALAKILKSAEESANLRLESLAEEFGTDVEQVKTCCRIGLPSNAIVALANEQSVDLIVMGTHGRTGVRQLMMGSVAQSVVNTANRPVLILGGSSASG